MVATIQQMAKLLKRDRLQMEKKKFNSVGIR
jgi:hypothetical protein